MLPLSLENEDDGLETIYGSQHDDGDQRERSSVARDSVNQVGKITAGSRQDDCSEKVDKDDKSHGKAAKAAELRLMPAKKEQRKSRT